MEKLSRWYRGSYLASSSTVLSLLIPCIRGCASVTTNEPILIHDYYQSLQFAWGFTLGLVHSVSSDKAIWSCTHHYNIPEGSSTAIKIPSTLPVHPSPPPSSSGNPWSFNCLHRLAFSRMSYSWNHIAHGLFILTSLSNMHFRFFSVFS